MFSRTRLRPLLTKNLLRKQTLRQQLHPMKGKSLHRLHQKVKQLHRPLRNRQPRRMVWLTLENVEPPASAVPQDVDRPDAVAARAQQERFPA